ncbi:hypothetical protein [Vibrio sagamiensis]|uniref:Flagellar export protein FliJ n=1 Tax=Vibrio sagamiensis NBRC 104589 TaxID=1219064 RepID=A0A511QDA9_9VIBR|nr:hypothetical protein [Vibrio sagamiensis]PNQ57779.1 flagellar export protein FliJ [Vibrio agarivorans]GEM75176.1 flagellar export protein FliJ [Vibrio sagamiensis NBRC 104589]
MEAKLKAVTQLWKIEEIQCEKIQRELQSVYHRYTVLTTQLKQLSELRQTVGQNVNKENQLCSSILINANQAGMMLQTNFDHYEQEKDILNAEYRAIKNRLLYTKVRAKGLEKLVHQWRTIQKTAKIKRELFQVEDIINARLKSKV